MENTSSTEWKPDYFWEIHGSQKLFLDLARNISSVTQCPNQVIQISRLLYMYAVPILIAISLLLNGVMLLVFLSKALRVYSCSSYLSTLAIVDFLALSAYVPRGWLKILLESLGWGTVDLHYDSSIPVCKVVTFSCLFLKFMSAWCLVALAYSRIAAVKDTVRMKSQQTAKSARIIVVYVACLGILINGHVFFTWSIVERPSGISRDIIRTYCSPSMSSTQISLCLMVVTLVANVGIPALATLTLSVYLMRGIREEKHFLSRRLSSKVIFKLKKGRQISQMVLSLCGAATILGIPHTVAWVVVVLQHLTRNYFSCQYWYSLAARDITEITYMSFYTCKLFVCMMSAMPLLNPRPAS